MKPNVRRQSRSLAVQGVYSWQVSKNPIGDIEQQLLLEQNTKHLDVGYFQDLLRGVAVNYAVLDEAVKPFIDRPFEEIDLVEKAILRVSAYELKFRLDVPYKVIINEAIELAKAFAADDSHKFVNGILDKSSEIATAKLSGEPAKVGFFMGEFELIAECFSQAGHKRADVQLGVGDDGAVVQVREGFDLVVTTDTMVEGVHFFPDMDPRALGHKLVTVNISDLAAMGAEPTWLSLGLTLPKVDPVWLKAFAEGLSETADYYSCQLIGGDTCRGPLTLTLTAHGVVPRGKALTRRGAQVGDYIYVTGTLGDAALGLMLLQQQAEVSKKHRAHIMQRFHYPTARVALGQSLRSIASSCMDLSDGLFGDIQHILQRSNVGASIDVNKLPLSQALRDSCDTATALRCALSGGEDYELLFTVPENKRSALEVLLSPYGVAITCIGRITGVSGKLELKQGDQLYAYQHQGYQHFA